MITRIEALSFRCLQYVGQDLNPFHVLVGPNASGKTTFLDTVAFLGDLVSDGLEKALATRSDNFSDLLWKHEGQKFEIAIEAAIPSDRRALIHEDLQHLDTIRYEVVVRLDPSNNAVGIHYEKGLLQQKSEPESELSLFPLIDTERIPKTLQSESRKKNTRLLFHKSGGGNDKFYSESYKRAGQGNWLPTIKLGPLKSTLGNLPYDESNFPAATWLRNMLVEGVQKIVLNSLVIRRASPPAKGKGFRSDGSNLPWVIEDLRNTDKKRFQRWIAHLKTALPDIQDIRTVERPDDKHRYLMVCYETGVNVPSWMISDGTLRLLALTLPAYLPQFEGVYLIEEPENGIHPRAVATMFQSLSSTHDAQILLASHSPTVLNLAEPADILCFAKSPNGATNIVRGDRHPQLKYWQGETPLGNLFAAGVLD
jgi:predicted ATPase